ncbi:hypothetical protein [Mucilaginibacter sp.]
MKKTIYMALGLLLSAMAGCKKNTITQPGTISTGARIKFVHVAPGVPALNGFINNTRISPLLAVTVTDNLIPTSITTGYVYQGTFPSSNYTEVAAGSTAIKVETSAPVPALKSAQTVVPGTAVGTANQATVGDGAYSIFTMGLPGAATNGLTTRVVEDKFPDVQSGKAYIRLAYMIPNGNAVDMTGTYTPTGGTATAKTLTTNISYGTVTDFIAVDVNPSSTTSYTFQLKLTGTATNLGTVSSAIALTPGRYYTIIGRGLAADYAVPGTSITLRASARPTIPPGNTIPEIYYNPAGITFYTNK